MLHRYDERDSDDTPTGFELVEGADLSPLAAALAVVGFYIGRGLLVGGLVCALVVSLFLAGGCL